ncbi:MAG: phosphate propanoyltransferase [Patescibacteria group bacterium]|nr:phosphate propanoyltransferase [Patescibacteria group bacterium]
MQRIPIEISARHLHLSRADTDIIFGKGYQLHVFKKLSQPGSFSTQETVKIIYKGKSGEKSLEKVRIIAPLRDHSQLELAGTDARRLGAKPPIRLSGNIEGTPGFEIVGPAGAVAKEEGMIIAKRHLHVSPKEAEELSLKNGNEIKVKAGGDGERELIFCKVVVRVAENFKLAMHIDTDESNAVGMTSCGYGEITL